jgi:hypothetical protein
MLGASMGNLIVLFIAIFIFYIDARAEVKDAWSQLGEGDNLVVRAIVNDNICPQINIDGKQFKMNMRAKPSKLFNNYVCEVVVAGNPKKINVADHNIPVRKATLDRVLIIGDTGCGNNNSMGQICENPDSWPFPTIAGSIAKEDFDLIIHMGDYHYRGCINDKCYGEGDWNNEFFNIVRPIIHKAPWIMVRGNHENCDRAGEGWMRMLSLFPYHGETSCFDFEPPYIMRYNDLNFAMLDNSAVYDIMYNDKQRLANKPIITLMNKHLRELHKGLATHEYNWLLMHRPFWSYFAFKPYKSPEDLINFGEVMQNAKSTELLSKIDLILTAHVHVFQALGFNAQDKRPPQLMVGTGGAQLVPKKIFDSLPNNIHELPLEGSKPDTATLIREFGYALMERVKGKHWRIIVKNRYGKQITQCELTSTGALQCAS